MLVKPIINKKVRNLCQAPYQNHPKGCPNWNKRDTCPPAAPLLNKIFDLSKPVYVIFNAFDFAGHVARMKKLHPDWSKRQLECCLYWQGTARKQLRHKIAEFLNDRNNLIILDCPEACGVDVTATMESIGVVLEWPPKQFAYQVALIGEPSKVFL